MDSIAHEDGVDIGCEMWDELESDYEDERIRAPKLDCKQGETSDIKQLSSDVQSCQKELFVLQASAEKLKRSVEMESKVDSKTSSSTLPLFSAALLAIVLALAML